MTTGTVKFFNAEKSFCFISHKQSEEMIVHYSKIKKNDPIKHISVNFLRVFFILFIFRVLCSLKLLKINKNIGEM